MTDQLHLVYAAALKALRKLTESPGHPGVLAALDQADTALAHLRGGHGSDVMCRLLAELRACDREQRAYSDELGEAFRAAHLASTLVMSPSTQR